MNKELFLFINSLAGKNEVIDFLMILFAKGVPYLFILVLLFLWFKDNKKEALFAGYAAVLGVIISKTIGLFYFHPRPFVDKIGVMLINHKADSSFPSDHTTFSMSIAFMLLSFKTTRNLGIILVVLALLCGIGRVYVGVHYPFDILGGIIVGGIAAFIIYVLKGRFQNLNDFIIKKWEKLFHFKAKN